MTDDRGRRGTGRPVQPVPLVVGVAVAAIAAMAFVLTDQPSWTPYLPVVQLHPRTVHAAPLDPTRSVHPTSTSRSTPAGSSTRLVARVEPEQAVAANQRPRTANAPAVSAPAPAYVAPAPAPAEVAAAPAPSPTPTGDHSTDTPHPDTPDHASATPSPSGN